MQDSLRRRRLPGNAKVVAALKSDLAVLLVWLAIFGFGLRLLVGWPEVAPLPERMPSWSAVQVWAQSPGGSLQGLISVAASLAWAVWLWTLASVLLRVAIDVADALTRGAQWVSSLRRASDWLTLPLVRRAVDASLAGLLLARVVSQPAIASANPFADVPIVAIVRPSSELAAIDGPVGGRAVLFAQALDEGEPVESSDVVYTVKHGDTLSRIALAFYGDAEQAEQIYQANLGRPEPGDRQFNRHGLIIPGWTLQIPSPMRGVVQEYDGGRCYVVKDGDTLSGIATNVLGDERRYRDCSRSTSELPGWGRRVRYYETLTSFGPGSDCTCPMVHPFPTHLPRMPSTVPWLRCAYQQTSRPRPRRPPQSRRTGSQTERHPQRLQRLRPRLPLLGRCPQSHMNLLRPRCGQRHAPARTAQPTSDPADAKILAGAGAAAVAALAAGTLIVRRRRPAPIPTGPESDLQIESGFAEADPVEGLARRLANTTDPPSAVASLMSQAYATIFAEQLTTEERHQVSSAVSLTGARHGRTATTLMLSAPVPARPHLMRAMRAAAEQAFGKHVDVDGLVSHDGDVLVRLTWDPRRPVPARVLELVNTEPNSGLWPPPLLVRLLVGYDRQPIDVNWHMLSNVLLASPTGQGAETPLVALLASLASVRRPEDLGIILLMRPHTLPDEIALFPHCVADPTDPTDSQAVDNMLKDLRQELDRRAESGASTDQPDLVVVVREICDLEPSSMAQLGMLAAAGPTHHMRVVVASERPVTELRSR